jgi:hypothetical protein
MRMALAIALLIVLLLSALFAQTVQCAETTSANIKIRVGEKFPLTIRFNERQGGCRFVLDPFDESLVKMVGREPSNGRKPGSTCWITWIFEGVAKGEAIIKATVMDATTDERVNVLKVTVKVVE